MDTATIKKVQKAGFDVYMRDPSDTYMYYTDGERIAYLQQNRWQIKISTVHKPNHAVGTGYQVNDNPARLDKSTLKSGFLFAPAFASMSDRDNTKKYKNMDEFLSSSKWNQGFKKVPLVNPVSKE